MDLLEDLETEFGNIRIVRYKRDGSHAYYQGCCSHSEANKEGVSTCIQFASQRGLIIVTSNKTMAELRTMLTGPVLRRINGEEEPDKSRYLIYDLHGYRRRR